MHDVGCLITVSKTNIVLTIMIVKTIEVIALIPTKDRIDSGVDRALIINAADLVAQIIVDPIATNNSNICL